MDSPSGYSESLDQDDIVYPCKGCGEILEEGKAFELAGNRWHIECFKCNTCGEPLDSDANLLLLGDGSLICNKCTYSCNACGNKIEDLAILTGDQAFCANCFRCRNCKRKIENLRYARTSQGIFCMSCHESLMARRRKKSKQKQLAAATNGSGPVVLDKSLPALPPSAVPSSLLSPEIETPPSEMAETPRDLSPMATSRSRKDRSPSNAYRDTSPQSSRDQRGDLTLPASTYNRKGREPETSSQRDGADDMFIQLALDPEPAPGPSPMAGGRPKSDETSASAGASDPNSQRDYFNTVRSQAAPHRDVLREMADSRSSSMDRDRSHKPSPHIAFQEKPRRPSELPADPVRKKPVPTSTTASPDVTADRTRAQQTTPQTVNKPGSKQTENFKLQEVPQSKKTGSRRASKSDVRISSQGSPPSDASNRAKSPMSDFTPSSGGEDMAFYPPATTMDRPRRGDSLQQSLSQKAGAAKTSPSTPSAPTAPTHERKSSASSALHNRDGSSLNRMNGGQAISSPIESPSQKNIHDMAIPPRAPSRPAHPGIGPTKDSYTAPRAPPAPPAGAGHHKPSESLSSIHSDAAQFGSPPGMLRYSEGPEFSLEADITRIMEDGPPGEKDPSVLRRVSNAMYKHSRSVSDRGSRASNTHKIRPTNGSVDIGSPTTASPESKGELIELRNNLRRANQKVAELEAEKLLWQEKLDTTPELKQANTELREKRSTMAILDTQREMIIRELEIMTDHLAKAKDSSKPISTAALKSNIYEEFSHSLQKLKDTLGQQIESQMEQRQELTAEISTLIQMKDKGFQEYESLTAKNQQLMEMNHSLVNGIQDVYKANKGQNTDMSLDGLRPTADALGIYRGPQKDSKSEISVDHRSVAETSSTNPLLDIDPDQTVISKPQIIDVKKSKAKTFGKWKTGGSSAAKTLTKNLKTAFASNQNTPREEPYSLISSPYSTSGPTQQDGMHVAHVSGPTPAKLGDANRAPFGLFSGQGKQGQNLKAGGLKNLHNSSNTDLATEPAHVLFGSDLQERCSFEKRNIPFIVIRCIQEVQVRGMDLEGIYRKSGSNSAVNAIRAGFEANEDYDISDPDLDITAITSVLKQYFRKLPNPLINFDVYDRFLQAGVIEDREKRVIELRNCLNGLPRAHLECLQFLVFHLAQVTTKLETKMTALNLAVVFAPTIMRPATIEREMADMQSQKVSVMHMIEDVKDIFGTEVA